MEPYERNISLRTIYLTLLRRIEVILLIFVPVALISFIVTNYGMKKQYTSTLVFRNNDNSSLSNANQLSIADAFTTNNLETVANNLATNNIKHSNGSAITASEINLKYTTSTSAVTSFNVTFTSTDSSITKPVLDEVANVVIEPLTTEKGLTKLVTNPASNPSKTSKENTYFLIALAGGFVVACAIPFIYEIVADQVYDKKDLTLWGAEGFELKASK